MSVVSSRRTLIEAADLAVSTPYVPSSPEPSPLSEPFSVLSLIMTRSPSRETQTSLAFSPMRKNDMSSPAGIAQANVPCSPRTLTESGDLPTRTPSAVYSPSLTFP